MVVDLSEDEINRIFSWAQESNGALFSSFDGTMLVNITDDTLLKKLEKALEEAKKKK